MAVEEYKTSDIIQHAYCRYTTMMLWYHNIFFATAGETEKYLHVMLEGAT